MIRSERERRWRLGWAAIIVVALSARTSRWRAFTVAHLLSPWVFACLLVVVVLPTSAFGAPSARSTSEESTLAARPLELASLTVSLRYAVEPSFVVVELAAPWEVEAGGAFHRLAAGQWKIGASSVTPAKQRWQVFSKTFKPGEKTQMEAYRREWTTRGYEPEVIPFGVPLRLKDGRIIDNRVFWISVARVTTESEADALIKRLEREEVFAWKRAERVAPGAAAITLEPAAGGTALKVPTPCVLNAPQFRLKRINTGFWSERRGDLLCRGPLILKIDPAGALEVYGELPLEHYLQGALPAEMPAGWATEALKAQAVAARSEVLAGLSGLHHLEGFDFCILEHCRAFRGLDEEDERTDSAIRATTGEVLVSSEGTVVPTVFSATCGGFTENNEIVWAGPANPALRGRGDLPGTETVPSPENDAALRKWLGTRGKAYCSQAKNYRWTRNYSAAELTRIVNQHYPVGRVKAIEEGDRGVSGRLKSIKIIGSERTETVHRELSIRRALGGLPSAMILIEALNDGGIRITGGGQGHGVGLCQNGAQGMALAGRAYRQILLQYFAGATIERLE